MKRVVIISLVLLTLVLATGVITAASSVRLAGNDTIARTYSDSRTNFFLVEKNSAFEYDAKVTRWNVYGSRAVPVALMIYRPTGTPDNWSADVVYDGRGDLKTPTVGAVNSYDFASPVEVQAGDVIGLYFQQNGSVPHDRTPPADYGNKNSGTVAFTVTGAGPTAFTGSSDRTYSFNVEGYYLKAVNVDVKPGGDPNSINLCAKGVVPVAILSDGTFDATEVDPSTVTFAGANVKQKNNGSLQYAIEDVNNDGLPDMVLHFPVEDLQLNSGSTEGVVSGMADGFYFEASDTVNVVKECQ